MPPKRPTKKAKPVVAREDLTPSELIASEIVARFGDLTPSVNRILDAPMGEAGRLQAITLFRDSLTQPNDPMRNPFAAIAAGQALEAV
ncbi:MAG: hypothetical protein AB7V43_19365 [Acidimicrobiia bacterium]